jgi:hypothetical protein
VAPSAHGPLRLHRQRDAAILRLGPVDDQCEVWLGGRRLDSMTKESNPKDRWSMVTE